MPSARLISQFTKSEITKLFSQARRCLKHSGLDILLHPKSYEFGRILVVTPRKIGNAAERNRIRRRFKALYYEEKFMDKGFDCIVIIKKEGVDLPFQMLKQLLEQAFQSFPQRNHEIRP